MYEFGLITTFSKTPGAIVDYQDFKTALMEKYPSADYCDILDKIVIEYDNKKIKFTSGSKGKFNYDKKMCSSGAARKDKNIGDTKAKTGDKYNDIAMDKNTKQNLGGDTKATTGDRYNDIAMDKATKQNLGGNTQASTSNKYNDLALDKSTKQNLGGVKATTNSNQFDSALMDKSTKQNLGGDTQAKTNTKYNDAQLDAETKKNLANKTPEELDYDYYKYQKVGDPGYKKRKDYDLDKFNVSSQRYIRDEADVKKSKKKPEAQAAQVSQEDSKQTKKSNKKK